MPEEDRSLDRLVARHELPLALSIRWDTKQRRRLTRRGTDHSVGGMILDLSLTGALIEVVDPASVEIDDLVKIRLGDRSGVVQVKHMKPGERTGSVVFGVRFVDTTELEDQITLIVERIRGNSDGIRAAWEKAN